MFFEKIDTKIFVFLSKCRVLKWLSDKIYFSVTYWTENSACRKRSYTSRDRLYEVAINCVDIKTKKNFFSKALFYRFSIGINFFKVKKIVLGY